MSREGPRSCLCTRALTITGIPGTRTPHHLFINSGRDMGRFHDLCSHVAKEGQCRNFPLEDPTAHGKFFEAMAPTNPSTRTYRVHRSLTGPYRHRKIFCTANKIMTSRAYIETGTPSAGLIAISGDPSTRLDPNMQNPHMTYPPTPPLMGPRPVVGHGPPVPPSLAGFEHEQHPPTGSMRWSVNGKKLFKREELVTETARRAG